MAAVRNAIVLSGAADVQEALEEAGIESLVVDVAGLLLARYPGIGSRKLDTAALLLRARDAPGADAIERRVRARRPKVTSFTAVEGVPALELRYMAGTGPRSAVHLEECFVRSRNISWERRKLRVASAADLAACACVQLVLRREQVAPPKLADLAVAMGDGRLTWKEVEARMPPDVHHGALDDARRRLEVGPPGGWADFRNALWLLVKGP
jgi:hypothetical protein